MDTAKPTSLPAALMHFFGKKPDQTTADFMQEIKALTDEDRKDFRAMLSERGYNLN